VGIRDRLLTAGRGLASAAGQALIDFSGPEEEQLVKAGEVPTEPAVEDEKTLLFDPFAVVEQLGFREKPTRINYNTLKDMAQKVEIIESIIKTRINQVASFAQPSHDRHQLGFRIKVRDSEKEPTKQDKIWIREAEKLIMANGVPEDPRVRNNFEMFLRKFIRDSLTLDQGCFEVVPNRKGQPAKWYAVDGSTIRLADMASTYNKTDPDQTIRYVQIYDGIVIAEYTAEELCFGIRNPRTDIRLHGYGVSELETLVKTVTAMLYGWEYNVAAFRNASILPGLLNFKGTIPDKQLKAFRRHWYLTLSGVANAFKTPITNAEEIQWLKLKDNNRDMEYSAWYDFLIKVACSGFVIDPVEVNFKYGNSGQRAGGLNEASNKEKITESKERGLRPLLNFTSGCINSHIIWPMNEDFEFAFVGLDAKTRDDVADINAKLVKTTRTVDELRAEDDKEPLPDGLGEVILEANWIQWAQQKQAQAEGAGEEGYGEEGGEVPDFTQMFGEEEEEPKEKPAEKPEKPAEKKPEEKITKSITGRSGRQYTIDLEL
jgi:hypothetical protein